MSLINLILLSLIPLIGIWLSYWSERKYSEDAAEIKKLKKKKISSFISSALVIIAFGASYFVFDHELKDSKVKGKQELETYKNSNKARESLESIISKSNINLKKSDSIILISDNSIRRLDSLNKLAFNLNHRLATELELQKETNKGSHLLVSSMLSQQRRKEKSYIDELKISFEQFNALSTLMIMSGFHEKKNYSEADSNRKIDQFIAFTTQSISILISQLQNDFLIRDTVFQQVWLFYLSSLRNIQLHMFGYAPYPLFQDWEILQENSRTFVRKIEDFLIYEPFTPNHFRDQTHQLKLITEQEFRSE